MMIIYTTKDKVPELAVYLICEAQKHGDLYLGSFNDVTYLDEEKRGK